MRIKVDLITQMGATRFLRDDHAAQKAFRNRERSLGLCIETMHTALFIAWWIDIPLCAKPYSLRPKLVITIQYRFVLTKRGESSNKKLQLELDLTT